MTSNTEKHTLPPHAVMNSLMDGFVRTQIIAVAAELRVADALHSGPLSIDQITDTVGADSTALGRVMRSLASTGIFTENSDGLFGQTPLSETLRSDAPGTMRDFAILYGQEWYRRPWARLTDTVRSGDTVPFEETHGMHMFEYLKTDEAAASVFNDAMTSTTQLAEAPITEAYDFTPFSRIVDVGGGQGAMIAAALDSSPASRGVLFDMPDVAPGARDLLVQKDVAGRCEVVGGNFFDSVPYGGDLYILKFILHDWGDEQATAILRSCRQQIRPDGKLLLIERGIVSAGNDPDPVKFMDLHMMVLLGGQERTESEFRSLLTDAGFELVRVIPTQSPVNVLLEARPV